MSAHMEAFKAVLEEFCIDPTDTSYSGGEDAAEHLSGKREIHRFCLITRSGEWQYAHPSFDTLTEAKASAMDNIDDDLFAEVPVAIINLETGERFRPVFDTVKWLKEEA